MDATCRSVSLASINRERCWKASRSGANSSRCSPSEAVVERALRYCDLAVAQGLLAIRSHVDICDDRLLAVDALLDVKQPGRALSSTCSSSPSRRTATSARPAAAQEPRPRARQGRRRGRRHPAFRAHHGGRRGERRGALRDRRTSAACASTCIATRATIRSRATSRRWPARPSGSGLHGRVAGSHLTSMHSMDNYYVSKLLPLMAEAGVQAIANPLINIVLQGRHDTYPKRRGMTRVPEMRTYGINVAFGQDCCMDPLVFAGRRRHARRRAYGPARRRSSPAARRCASASTR